MVQPIPKKYYEKALTLNINEIILSFSGGSDEGYLEVEVGFKDLGEHPYQSAYWENGLSKDDRKVVEDFISEVEEWAEETYAYSGAGDGTPYGDTITYKFDDMTVEHDEWYMSETHDEKGSALEFAEEEE